MPHRPTVLKDDPHNRPKEGDERPQLDFRHSRRVDQLCRDRHSGNRNCEKPYSEILAQAHDQQHGSSLTTVQSKVRVPQTVTVPLNAPAPWRVTAQSQMLGGMSGTEAPGFCNCSGSSIGNWSLTATAATQ